MDDVGGWVDDQDTCISFKKIILFYWLRWVLVALCRLSLLGTILYCSVRASH